MTPHGRVYEFGQFRLETAERRLLRGQTPISLMPKTFEILLALVESSGHLVTKDDLMKRVWPDAFVEEANVARHVWTLRQALGDDNGTAGHIETIPKLGYRFLVPVTEVPAGGAELETVTAAPRPTPARAPAPRRVSRFGLFVLGAVALLVLASVDLIRHSRKSATPVKTQSGRTFLTDGRGDDVGAYWTNSGQIYFSRAVTKTRTETWTMNADGTNQHRANTEIKSLLTGRWSPDEKKVIFTKDDGTRTVYLADTNGANEIALPFMPGNLDWSPDGSRFVYQARTAPEISEIFMYTLDSQTSVSLTGPVASADPSFSPDGTQIAFTSWRDGNAEIYVMDADGSNVRRLTNHPAFDNYPVFSPDGTQVAFQSNRADEHVEIYLQNLNDGTPPKRLTMSSNLSGLAPKCWSLDGTRMLVYTELGGANQVEIIKVDPFPAQLFLGDDAADLTDMHPSPDRTRFLFEARQADRSLELRVTDLGNRRTRTIFRTEPGYPMHFHLQPAWSPDGSLIAFSARAGGNSEVFVVKPDGTELRNVTRNPLLDASPVFTPDGREIVFARDAFGQAHLYRMDLDGGNQHRVSDKPGYELEPVFSPDGAYLAFAGDRDSRGLQIVLLDWHKPTEEKAIAAPRPPSTSPAFSPDGKRMAFVATSDGNSEIYVMNADGTGRLRLTRNAAEDVTPHFSGDGEQIVFSSNRSGRFALYQVQSR